MAKGSGDNRGTREQAAGQGPDDCDHKGWLRESQQPHSYHVLTDTKVFHMGNLHKRTLTFACHPDCVYHTDMFEQATQEELPW